MLDDADQPTSTMGSFNHSPKARELLQSIYPTTLSRELQKYLKKYPLDVMLGQFVWELPVKEAQASWVKQYLGNTTPNTVKI